MERYAVTIHRDSQIKNDPIETMKIVNALPKLKFEE